MGWRAIRSEDIVRGTVVRLINSEENTCPFSDCVILKVSNKTDVLLARPIVYAHKWDSNSPMMYSELFSISVESLLKRNDYQVYESNKGEVYSLIA